MNAVVKPDSQVTDRRKFLGGSDIAAVLQLSPWTTPLELYQKKTTPPAEADKARRGFFSRGHRWEAAVGEMLVESLKADGHTVEVVAANQRYTDKEYDFMACEIDFELRLDGETEITNCELKTVHPFKAKEWGEQGTDDLPVWYTAQAMYGLGITGRNRCIVAALFGADELKTYPVLRDDETIAGMRAHGARFWNDHVLALVPPEPISLDDLQILFPKDADGPALIADDDLIEKVLRLRAIDREIDARQGEWDSLEFEIKRIMKGCTEIVIRDKSALSWKLRKHSHLDQTALKERFPKIHKELMVNSESRVFSLKKFGWDR